uniref:Phosphoglucosamine mutase n=1 Tax=Lygus hesperus TaxID=30085 RepID=A0A0A9XYP5_LYGHE
MDLVTPDKMDTEIPNVSHLYRSFQVMGAHANRNRTQALQQHLRTHLRSQSTDVQFVDPDDAFTRIDGSNFTFRVSRSPVAGDEAAGGFAASDSAVGTVRSTLQNTSANRMLRVTFIVLPAPNQFVLQQLPNN